jgi:mono/diheme cytochrome c family protein
MRLARFTIFVAVLWTAAAGAQEIPNAAAIRAGHNLATSVCFACHVVSPNTTAPVIGPGVPTFQEIADRPGITADVLAERMKSARWHDPALAPRLLPMSHLSDTERLQVAAYILSLRARVN